MIIFDNISSLILFKRQFTAVIVKSLVFEVQDNFHHQILDRLFFGLFFILFFFKLLSRHETSEVKCLSYYLHTINPSMHFQFICLPCIPLLVIRMTTFMTKKQSGTAVLTQLTITRL